MPDKASLAPELALAKTAGVTFLAAFLINEGCRATFGAEVAQWGFSRFCAIGMFDTLL